MRLIHQVVATYVYWEHLLVRIIHQGLSALFG